MCSSRLLLILRSMDESYLSFLRTNDLLCVFRHYNSINANTECQIVWIEFRTDRRSELKLFTKVISRRQKSLLASKEKANPYSINHDCS